MKLAKIRNCLLVAISILMLAGGQLGGMVFAADASSDSNSIANKANSMKISPLRTDITIEAGESGTVEVLVTNISDDAVILRAIANDFVAGDEKGTPSIILDENSYAPSHSLKRFMKPIENITLGPGETRKVEVQIEVPADAMAGGYYGVIRFAPATASGQPVDLNASVASLILLRVPGPVVEELALTNFDIRQNGSSGSNFRTPDNLELLLRFENKGNVHVAPFGQIVVQKGKEVIYDYKFNQKDPKGEVLPNSARRWEVPLENLGKFGKYKIIGTFGYGTQGQTINVEKTIWIIPTLYILGAVGGLLLLIAIIVGIWLFLRSYKRRILRSARRRY